MSKPVAMETMHPSAWSPLGLPLFRNLWLATLASNIGAWMHDIGAGWLMTTLSPTPVMVALVQTATTLPIFLLVLPAGALADIVDRRRYLIVVQVWLALVSACLGVLTLNGNTTAWSLVCLTFAMGVGSAMMLPAWAALTPELVVRSELPSAITLNSMGMNIARTIGPALAGVIVSFAGTGPVFILNAVSYLGVIYVLVRWRRETVRSELPSERFFSAMRSGFRFARHAPELQAAMVRGLGFFLFTSASWALLPLIVRNLVNGGPEVYGILVGSIGAGAVAGAFALPKIRQTFSRDVLVAAASVLYAGTMVVLATSVQLYLLCLAMALSGFAWIAALSSLQVTAQLVLPDWVRSRGLAVFMMVFMGSMAFGSLLWGKVAEETSISLSLLMAAAGGVVAVALTWRWRIAGAGNTDLSPSMHWPALVGHDQVSDERGPVLVTIQYEVRSDKVKEFLSAIHRLGKGRRRDGAFAWGIFEHTEKPNLFIETFNVESWLEHRRQHERVTDADRLLQAEIGTLLVAGSQPLVAHYVTPATRAQAK
ncbi:MAG TPA: MFS transporter [Xanthomonadales bacterium]|nr:MFS transporter [Xanthomonadales bacterium]